MENWILAFTQTEAAYVNVYQQILRYCLPVLVGFLLFLCIKPLLTFRREPEKG